MTTPSRFRAADLWTALLSGYSFIGLNAALQIGLVPLYLSSLGKTEFGLLMMLMSAVNFMTLGTFGLAGNVLRSLAGHAFHQDMDAFSRSYTRARLLFDLYALIAAGCAAGAFFLFYGAAHPDGAFNHGAFLAIAFAAAQAVLNADVGVVRLALAAQQRQAASNLFQLLGLVLFAALVIPWLLLGGGMEGVLGALFAGNLIARVCTSIYIRWARLPIRLALEAAPLRQAAREYLNPTGLVYFAYGAFFVVSQSDTFLIGWLTDADTAAEFVLYWRIPEALILLLARIPEHAQVGFAYLHHEGRGEVFTRFGRRVSFWLQILAFTIAAAYALLGPWIVGLWVGAEAAPDDRWGYVLAGVAVFWLAFARLPAAFANMQGFGWIKRMTVIAGAEIVLKLAILLALNDYAHALAPMLAVNAVHLLGLHWIYRHFMTSLMAAPPPPRPDAA